MCGIIGINRKDKEGIKKAADLFAYRGPDSQGFYEDNFVTFGHNRLKIIDIDDSANQPMLDDTGDIIIVFNGEIYNFKKLKKELLNKYNFKTQSDTEVLIFAYKKYGVDLVKYIQGMYAFAIYDKKKKKIFIFRDHLGIKPLYYYFNDKTFIFSSEMKGIVSLLRSYNLPVEINKESINLYSVYGYIPSPHSLYKNIYKLENSSYLVFNLEKNKIAKIEKNKCRYREYENKSDFETIFEKKVLDHIISDVPVGLFFSGGTDSSLIASLLKKNNIELKTFSIEMIGKKQDKDYSEQIRKYLGFKSKIYNFSYNEFDEIYEELMSKIDEPISDNSIFPTFYISKKSSKSVKVVLSGEGGDEFFYGYVRSSILYRLNKYRDYNINWVDRLFFSLPSFRGKNYLFEKIFIFFKKPLSYYLLNMSPSRDLAKISSWVSAKKEIENKKLSPLDLDKVLYLENHLLKKTDMATSFNSIEGRVPLLDIEIVGNSLKFNDFKGLEMKPFLKRLLAKYLPASMVYREKSGFGMNLVNYFEKSDYLKKDLIRAIDYLRKEKIIDFVPKKKIVFYIKKYPNFCFSIIVLYRVIKNNS